MKQNKTDTYLLYSYFKIIQNKTWVAKIKYKSGQVNIILVRQKKKK